MTHKFFGKVYIESSRAGTLSMQVFPRMACIGCDPDEYACISIPRSKIDRSFICIDLDGRIWKSRWTAVGKNCRYDIVDGELYLTLDDDDYNEIRRHYPVTKAYRQMISTLKDLQKDMLAAIRSARNAKPAGAKHG